MDNETKPIEGNEQTETITENIKEVIDSNVSSEPASLPTENHDKTTEKPPINVVSWIKKQMSTACNLEMQQRIGKYVLQSDTPIENINQCLKSLLDKFENTSTDFINAAIKISDLQNELNFTDDKIAQLQNQILDLQSEIKETPIVTTPAITEKIITSPAIAQRKKLSGAQYLLNTWNLK